MKVLEQVFPRREGDRLVHHRWEVDLETAGRVLHAGDGGTRLRREAAEMAEHFPRWLLTVSLGRDRVLCGCGGMLVFDRGLRCVICDRRASLSTLGAAQLAWFGLLPPVGLGGLPSLRDRLVARTPRLHVVGEQPSTGTYLLVPLVAVYLGCYPESPPRVAYLPGFFEIRGMPREAPSHEVHLLGGGFMCLFAGGEWRRAMTCREVLQQRAYAHVIKLLNWAAGKRNAFAIVS